MIIVDRYNIYKNVKVLELVDFVENWCIVYKQTVWVEIKFY